ncbi:MAG: hypothetical protein HYY84_16450 [Deltaproteobacteria bacterium]|nr:hypothetical protein [Deltaproteobacteria bacterium]
MQSCYAPVTVQGTDCDGKRVSQHALSTGDGRFAFNNVPGRSRRVVLKKGSFRTERALSGTVSTSGATTSPGTGATDEHEVCFDPNAAKIAVIKGSYDRVQDLLSHLGFAYDLHDADGSKPIWDYKTGKYIYLPNTTNVLLNRDLLLAHDILMVNCGSSVEPSAFGDKWLTVVANLRAFLAAGKSIYVSDWAFPVLEALYPDVADFLGTDSDVTDVRSGWAPTQTVNATVTNATVAAQVGSDHVNVVFDLGGWAVMASATAGSEVLIKSNLARQCPWNSTSCLSNDLKPLNDAPLTILFRSPSGGKVLYTSFHWDANGTAAMSKLLRAVLLML